MFRRIINRVPIRCIGTSAAIRPMMKNLPAVQKTLPTSMVKVNQTKNSLNDVEVVYPFKDPFDKYKDKKYNLDMTDNVCHVDHWEITKDFIEVIESGDYELFNKFHSTYVKNYKDILQSYSRDSNKLQFYDIAWRSESEIKFDVYNRMMNYTFREICYRGKADLKFIKWFNDLNVVEETHYCCALNTACTTGDLKLAKALYASRPVDFSRFTDPRDREDVGFMLDYFRSAASRGHLELAKWLYDLGAHKYGFPPSNVKAIVQRDAKKEVYEWLNTLPEFKNVEAKIN